MFRPVIRSIARPAAVRSFPRVAAPSSRFLSTAPPTQKSRSWKSMVARIGAAGTIIYYYNTTDVFAEEPRLAVQPLPETDVETEQLPTIDALAQERQRRRAAAETAETEASTNPDATAGADQLEQEADQQGAFNPETGEINWDCPCLGGMAHGPCGEEFKAAFSCFVFSTEEPKGMDCIDKFKGMQTCFREYPEIYGAELEPDEDEDGVPADRDQPGFADKEPANLTSATQDDTLASTTPTNTNKRVYENQVSSTTSTSAEGESDNLVPRAAFDETGANEQKKEQK